MEQTRAAARGRLGSISLGYGHSTGPLSLHSERPMLGRILAEWDSRPSGCLFLVPLWHPVLTAEQIGTVVAIASGPSSSDWRRWLAGEFRCDGRQPGRSGPGTRGGIVVVRELLNGESVSSTTWGTADARVAPLPPAGTEWWIGATAPVRIARAARLEDC